MSWKCKQCDHENEDSAVRCPACGCVRLARLVLTSDSGASWRTLIDAEITRRTYRHLYPGVEHQYIPRDEGGHPFSVCRNGANEWFIHANAMCRIGVSVNGQLCEDESMSELHNGDVICITPRGTTTHNIAPLKVSFVPIDN